MNIAEGFDLAAMGPQSADRYHCLIESMRLSFADALRYVADPAQVNVPVRALLSKTYARQRRASIEPGRAMAGVDFGDPGGASDTVYLTVVDGAGNACSLINSLYADFGSGLVVPGTGMVLQNRGANFSLDPGHPNALAGGKRPYHTIIPALATRGGELWLSFGVMGGFQQPQGHLQVISNLVDFGMDPQRALDALRFRIDITGSGEVGLEAGISPRCGAGARGPGPPGAHRRRLRAFLLRRRTDSSRAIREPAPSSRARSPAATGQPSGGERNERRLPTPVRTRRSDGLRSASPATDARSVSTGRGKGARMSDAGETRKSKSQRKREALASQALGESLIALGANDLARIPLWPDLEAAVIAAHGLERVARRRQIRYIARLLRDWRRRPDRAGPRRGAPPRPARGGAAAPNRTAARRAHTGRGVAGRHACGDAGTGLPAVAAPRHRRAARTG